MKSVVEWFMRLDFRKAIWIAPLIWTVHEAEEWDINSFEAQHFADPGYFSLIDHYVLWIGLGLVASYGIIWTCLTAWPKNPKFAAFLTLPFFVYCLSATSCSTSIGHFTSAATLRAWRRRSF